MADGVNKIVTPFRPIERAGERRDKGDRRNSGGFMRSPDKAAEKEKEPPTPPAEEGGKGKGGLVDIKA